MSFAFKPGYTECSALIFAFLLDDASGVALGSLCLGNRVIAEMRYAIKHGLRMHAREQINCKGYLYLINDTWEQVFENCKAEQGDGRPTARVKIVARIILFGDISQRATKPSTEYS